MSEIDMNAVTAKYHELSEVRAIEDKLHLSRWTSGNLSGIQQALAWVAGHGMEPIQATLTQVQLALVETERIKIKEAGDGL